MTTKRKMMMAGVDITHEQAAIEAAQRAAAQIVTELQCAVVTICQGHQLGAMRPSPRAWCSCVAHSWIPR